MSLSVSLFKRIKSLISDIAHISWKGASVGILASLIFYLLCNVFYIRLGISPVIDILLIVMAFILLGIVLYIAFKYIFLIVRKLNPSFIAIFFTVFFIASLLPGYFFTRYFIFFELVCGGMVGFAIYNGFKKAGSIILILIVTSLNIYLLYFLFNDGSDKSIPVSDSYWNQKITSVLNQDPSDKGDYKVKKLFYGSGNDKNRKEYAELVTIKTESVDATPFFDQTQGFQNSLLRLFWGFDSKNYPVNGRVWYPDGEGKFPLIIIAHGNHLMYDYSDPGYEYLGELLASRGCIVVSVDENFLNGDWKSDFEHKELFTRGWLILKHLENWRTWNETEGNPFYNCVDMNNIALIGHSRGGPSVMWASVINKMKRYYDNADYTFDFNFSIKGLVQIAPSELYYSPRKGMPLKLEDMDYLLLYGGHDQDLYTNVGNRFYNNITFSGSNYNFKSALYIYRGNHGQFNTIWGRKDRVTAEGWFLNLKPILEGEEQRKIAEIYISAFAEASLKGNKEFLPLFKDYRQGREFLPKDYYYNQFEDSSSKCIANFDEDLDINTTTLKGGVINGKNLKTWRENVLIFKNQEETSQNTIGVYLGWDNTTSNFNGKPQYEIQLNRESLQTLEPQAAKGFFISVCNNSNNMDTVDFTIELISDTVSIKKKFSSAMVLPPILKQKLSKCDYLFPLGKSIIHERVPQYVEFSLSELKEYHPDFKFESLNTIRFIFDQTEKGEIIIDKIGLVN